MDSFRPLVRFAGFEGEWKKVRLGDMFDIGNGYTPSKNVPQFWTNGTIPWFRMEDIRENGRILKDSIQHVTKEAVKSTGLFPANSIIISTTATIGEHALLIADSLANQRFSFLVRKLNRIDSMDIMFIFYHCFLLGDWCRSKSNAGGLLAVNMEDLRNYYFSLPSLPEQQKISEYFTEIDRAISLQTEKLSKLKQIKAASLQNMFPHEGETVPLVRFSGFGGEWKKVPFAEIAVRAEQSGVSGELPGVEYEDIVSGQGILNKDILKKECVKCGKLFHSGDILFGKLRPYLKNILFADFDGVAVGDFWVLRSTNSVNRFLYTIVNSYSFMKVANVSSGSKMPRADWKLVSSTRFAVPPTIEEQQAIANYFTKLDRKIDLETQKLEKLKQIKSACLSKMFV